jgi:arginine N-succinyltransferase
LFIASHPDRFQKQIIAELRAYLEPDGTSLFWNAVGRHFLDIDYDKLLRHLRVDPSFVATTVPPFPVYVSLLSPKVQRVIGKAHPLTQRALHLLLAEGFDLSEDVDLFDAGPKVHGDVSNIRTIREQAKARILALEPLEGNAFDTILSNDQIQFRACLAPTFQRSPEGVTLAPGVAKALQVGVGDSVRYVSAKSQAIASPQSSTEARTS